MTTTISASGSSTTAWQPRREVGVSPGALSSRSSSLSSEAESVLPPPFTITWQVVQAQFPPQACSRWMPCPSSTSRIDPGFPSCWKGARAGSNSITRSGSPFSKMTRILATDGNLASEVRRRDSGAARALRCKRDAMAIHYEQDGHIVTITIDRPEQRNSLDLEHFGQLADAWVRFRDHDQAYVAILTGVGDVYCVGADLKSFIPIVTERADQLQAGESKVPQEGSAYTMAHSLIAVLRDGATLPDGTTFTLYKPVIAAINGICAAGGLEMMWNTDLRVCADTAWFQLAEPRRGLFPGGGSTVQSVRQLTWCHAMEVVLLAERISAARAHEMGLVNRVVPRDRVLAEAQKLAETICLNGPLAVRACKRSAKESTFLPLKEALANEMSYSASVFMSEDAKEGIKAFKEKRPPVWRGR